MNNLFAAAVVAALAVPPLPTPKQAVPPPAPPSNPFLQHEKEAGRLPLVRVHSWYDWQCCSDNDCAPIKASDVTATASGWFVRRTGETLPYTGDTRVKKSKDDDFHLCISPAKPSNVLCLYVPPMGF